MTKFTVNPQRFDPYKNFKFRVKWDGRSVAGISKVGALDSTSEIAKHRDGTEPTAGPTSLGQNVFPAITLERGVTLDSEFEAWAAASLASLRKDIILDVFDEAGQLAVSYKIYRCWVSEYQALPDLDANANAVAIQHIKLENEGWDRDTALQEPTEPTEPNYTSTHA
jgi:phage tail-like protein